MSAKDKAENLKNMRLLARTHVKPLFPSPTLHSRDPNTRTQVAVAGQGNRPYLEAPDKLANC
jgi:hypothetical protein